ncbi:MAG: Uncharacterised protein [SAR116 cluster bacterium]|nr:MAG: Uncharacterised protein [SAR116 cluster bacterium]
MPDMIGNANIRPNAIETVIPCLNTRLTEVISPAPRACEVSEEMTTNMPSAKK